MGIVPNRWFANPQNRRKAFFVLALVLAFFIRLYYFSITKTQPLWWDEASYMSAAKVYAGLEGYATEGIRLPGFAYTMALFFITGLTYEPFMRFVGLFIPALIVIALTYFVLSEMYKDKRIAIVGMLITAVLWEHVFYSNRFHTENFALLFQYLAIWVFFKSYVKQEKFWRLSTRYAIPLIILCIGLSVSYRTGNMLFAPALALSFFVVNMQKITETKRSRTIALVVLLATLLIGYLIFPSVMAHPFFSIYYHPEMPIAWNVLTVFYGFYQSLTSPLPSLLFYTFILGTIATIYSLYLFYPKVKHLKKDGENMELKADAFNVLLLVCVLFTFIFLMRASSFEYRWFFPLLLPMLAFTAKGAVIVADYGAKTVGRKEAAAIILVLIIGLGMYTQIARTTPLVEAKATSYQPVKEAGLWIKENSSPGELILSTSTPQIAYYAERKTVTYGGMSKEELNEFIVTNRPPFIVVSVFEGNPPWLQEWLEESQQKLTPTQAYFADAQQQQALLIVYRIEHAEFA